MDVLIDQYQNVNLKLILIVAIIVFVLIKFTKLYNEVIKLPPGPCPLPWFGNILEFRGTKVHPICRINELRIKYGPVFTLWLGTKPYIYIYDLEIGRQLFHRSDVSGRPSSFIGEYHFARETNHKLRMNNIKGEILLRDNYHDIVFSDYTESLVTMRRAAISSARIISKSVQFSNSLIEIVDQTVEKMIKDNVNRPFSPEDLFYDMNLKVALLAAFGKIYSEKQEEFRVLKHFNHEIFNQIIHRMGFWEFFPIFRLLDKKLINLVKTGINELLNIIRRNLNEHVSTFNEQTGQNHFCDTFIAAQRRINSSRKPLNRIISNENIARAIFDLFMAGLETTHHTFKWMVLLMAYYPEVQQKLRQEIERTVGHRTPEYEDKHRSHYVMAFISEVLRFRNVNPLAVFHKTSVDLKIGKYDVPKGTGVFVSQFSIMNDENHWPNAQEFRPERFLSDGQYFSHRSEAYIPFGVGRRVCVGEKLAITDLFFMLIRLLQQTRDYTIELSAHSGLEPESQQFFEFTPKYFEINLKKN